ncbi:ATP-binding cassette domain-containing protein [Streptomyces sp. NPDC017520]|uniref:ATP-binding cassette domain-containing protein n=1 Tax=Streptomyces sp. NPDC017520 TaxID=3364998 RepID=UPI0037A73C07
MLNGTPSSLEVVQANHAEATAKDNNVLGVSGLIDPTGHPADRRTGGGGPADRAPAPLSVLCQHRLERGSRVRTVWWGWFALVRLNCRNGPIRTSIGTGLTLTLGQPFALLGSNGAGKTTTVRILATLLKTDAGGDERERLRRCRATGGRAGVGRGAAFGRA